MATERLTVRLPINDKLQEALQRLSEAGWLLEDGKEPIATYELVREAPMFGVNVDDSAIQILRNGKLIDG